MVKVGKDVITVLSHDINGDPVTIDMAETPGITTYLSEVTIFDDGVTVKDFLEHLERYYEQIDLVFDGSLGRLPFAIFLEDAKMPVSADDVFHCEFIEIIRDVRIDEYGMFEQPVMQAAIGNNVVSIELKPINQYINSELVLNPWYVIFNEDRTEELFKTVKPFTLFEVIHFFLNEISLHGAPSDRDQLYREIEPALIQEDLARQLDAAQQELDDAIEEEDYERGGKIRDRIKELKKRVQIDKPEDDHI